MTQHPEEPKTPLSEDERKAVQWIEQRRKTKKPRPSLQVKDGRVAYDGADSLSGGQLMTMAALNCGDFDFFGGLNKQIEAATAKGQHLDPEGVNFVMAVIQDIEPRNHVEQMLGAQMAVTHQAIMTFARRLAQAQTIPQLDSLQNAYNKLARTFAAQMDTLKRYRSTGEQKVTVTHVNTVVNADNAIVAQLTTPSALNERPIPQIQDQRPIDCFAPEHKLSKGRVKVKKVR